jgi:hypothetical protein
MIRFFAALAVFLIPLFSKAQTQQQELPVKDSINYIPLLNSLSPLQKQLQHTPSDLEKYLKADTILPKIADPLEGVNNIGLRYTVRSLEEDYPQNGHVQDSLQQAVRILLNYAKNDSVRSMVNYLKDYISRQHQTDAALRIVKRKIETDSLLSYDPEVTPEESDAEWQEEALNLMYNYIENDSVNQWLREISRDSVHVGLKNFMNDSLGFWVNNGRRTYKRFWLKKSKRDSIGIWVQNAPHRSLRILVDDDVYQESVQRTRKRGTRVKLEEKISEEDYQLANIMKRERLHEIWKVGSVTGLALNQGHVSNWAEGGESSVSALATVNMFAKYKKGNTQWDNTLDIKYGVLKTGENGFRKNEDKLELNTKYGQKAVDNWFYSAMFNMKTQMFRGYEYPDDDEVLVSSFMAPAYFLFSLGMDYKPKDELSVFLSPVTGKWTYVKDTTLIDQTKYGIDPDSRTKKETGFYVKLLHKWTITPDIVLDNKVELYSSYANKPKNIDINWELNLVLQVNQYINTKISTHLISDDDTGSKVQFKENLAVGVTYQF